jgi:hypothetical protein
LNKEFDKNKNLELQDLQPITVGEILYSFREFKAIFESQLKKEASSFAKIPLKIIIKRISNNKVIDLMGIRRLEFDKTGSCIWFVCSVNEDDSIFIHNNEIVKLKLTTKSVSEISDGFDHFKKIFTHAQNNKAALFYDLPVKIVIIKGQEGKDEVVVDTLDIVTTLMNDVGSGIFCHSIIDDYRMIRNSPSTKKLLDKSEAQYTNLINKLSLR